MPDLPPLVLVADDDDACRLIEGKFLQSMGLRTAEARDGEEVIRQALNLLPAAILLDLEMLEMGGLEVAQRLRADEKTRGIPIIAISGHDPVLVGEAAIRAGCTTFLQKPVRSQDLVGEIRRVLAG